MLPPGTRNLQQIDSEPDPINRVRDSATLLEYLLRTLEPGAVGPGGKPLGLAERIERHTEKFGKLSGVWFSIRIRNNLVHGGREGHDPVTEDEVDDASRNFVEAIKDLLQHMPHHIHPEVTGAVSDFADSPAQASISRGVKRLALAAAAVLLLLTLWAWVGGSVPVLTWNFHGKPAMKLLDEVAELGHRTARLRDGQGIDPPKQAALEAQRSAQAQYEAGAWRGAREALAEARDLHLAVHAIDDARSKLLEVRRVVSRARDDAEGLHALELAPAAWSEANAAWTRAEGAFADGALEVAREEWERASAGFTAAGAEAGAARVALAVGDAYASLVESLGPELLADHGGEAWSRAQGQAARAADAFGRRGHDEARAGWQAACDEVSSLASTTLLSAVEEASSRASALDFLATLLSLEPNHEAARAYFDERSGSAPSWWAARARALVPEATDENRAQTALALSGLALAFHDLGDDDSYSACIEDALQRSGRMRDSRQLARHQLEIGWRMLNAGDEKRAHELLRSATRSVSSMGDRGERAGLFAEFSVLAIALGDVATADEFERRVVKDYQGGSWTEHVFDAFGRTQIYAGRGQMSAAMQQAEITGTGGRGHSAEYRPLAYAIAARAAARFGDEESALAASRLAFETIEQHASIHGRAFGALAEADALLGRPADALRLVERAQGSSYASSALAAIACAFAAQGNWSLAVAQVDSIAGAEEKARANELLAEAAARHAAATSSTLLLWTESIENEVERARALAGIARGLSFLFHPTEPVVFAACHRRPLFSTHAVLRASETRLVERLEDVAGQTLVGLSVSVSQGTPSLLEVRFTSVAEGADGLSGSIRWTSYLNERGRCQPRTVDTRFLGSLVNGRMQLRDDVVRPLTYDLAAADTGFEGSWKSGEKTAPFHVYLDDLRPEHLRPSWCSLEPGVDYRGAILTADGRSTEEEAILHLSSADGDVLGKLSYGAYVVELAGTWNEGVLQLEMQQTLRGERHPDAKLDLAPGLRPDARMTGMLWRNNIGFQRFELY